jgi:alkylhydroperoxidase family enzyme
MKPMYLRDVESNANPRGGYARLIRSLQKTGDEVPQILHLFAYKPELTRRLEELSQAVMRGPSPLSPGLRELIAAFVSARNHCLF